ncbi:MAG: T9SS type A sorting domain-containing protein [Bacteroidota bacterium]
MKRTWLSLFFYLFILNISLAQDNSKWLDHLSYAETKGLDVWGEKVVVAGEYGVFIYDTEDESLNKYSKVKGLLGERITSLVALNNTDAFVIGFETGEFDIVYKDSKISHIEDIKNSNVTVTKSITSIAEYKNRIYLGTPFGIVEFNMEDERFGDTFYFGDNGSYIYVNDIALKDNILFAATENGVYSADAENPFLVDYKQWQLQSSIPVEKYNSIAEIGGKIIANNNENDTKQYLFEGTTWSLVSSVTGVVNVESNDKYITYSRWSNVMIYDENLNLVENIGATSENNFKPKSAIKTDGITWISTSNIGLVKSENKVLTNIMPDGPFRNYSFRVKADENKMYLLYGYYDQMYTPKGRRIGYDILEKDDWEYVNYTNFSNGRDLVDVAIDPKDSDHIYISTWSGTSNENDYYNQGVVEMQNNEQVEFWNIENSPIQKLHYPSNPAYVSVRVGGSVFDGDGNLWVANGWNVPKPIVLRKASGEWMSFSFDGVGSRGDNGIEGIHIDQNGNKWIGTRGDGIWVYNEGESLESTGDDKKLRFTTIENKGNLPDYRVNTIAIDKDNVAWIGTKLGLVIFDDIDEMFNTSSLNANPIIIEEDGVGKKLLGSQEINKIVVDGANNKWFATKSGGVYYTSSDGQKTIHHFTTENSPLFSDNVLDMDIDPETGRVYFVTLKGLVSFKGNATEGGNEFGKVYAYPNPVRPEYSGDIYIKGFTDRTNVKITDINGNLIFETISQGGQAVWNGKSFSGYKAASGVYLVFAISKDGKETSVTKILIVN